MLVITADWPQFRGPTGQGISDERNLPLTWSEDKNVRWKIAIPGRGWSSPVVQGDRIWLTTATEEGKSLRAIAIDRNTGAILQNVEVFRLKSAKLANSKNSFASPTPVIDGDRIYLHFGAFGTACAHFARLPTSRAREKKSGTFGTVKVFQTCLDRCLDMVWYLSARGSSRPRCWRSSPMVTAIFRSRKSFGDSISN